MRRSSTARDVSNEVDREAIRDKDFSQNATKQLWIGLSLSGKFSQETRYIIEIETYITLQKLKPQYVTGSFDRLLLPTTNAFCICIFQ